MASTTTAASTKRAFKDINVEESTTTVASKKVKMASSRAADINKIKSILNDINDPIIKASLEDIIKNPSKKPSAAGASIFPTVTPKKSEAALEKLTKQTIKTIQQCMNEKLKWKSSYKQLKDSATKGGRVEVVCTDSEVFERIFNGVTIKKGKDGKLSCSMKTNEEADKWTNMPFNGKSYRYNSSQLCVPYSASLNNNTLTFSYKFTIW